MEQKEFTRGKLGSSPGSTQSSWWDRFGQDAPRATARIALGEGMGEGMERGWERGRVGGDEEQVRTG